MFRPRMIIAGTSAYSRLLDYKRFREVRFGKIIKAQVQLGVFYVSIVTKVNNTVQWFSLHNY